MSHSLKISASVALSIWLFLAFHFGWLKFCALLPQKIEALALLSKDYILFWILGVGLGGIWLQDKKSMLLLSLGPVFSLVTFGAILKMIQFVFGYGELHKTVRQILSLFRTPGFIILFFTWNYFKRRLTSPHL